MIKAHYKLVRDNIPEIIISNNQKPKFRILKNSEYKSALKRKLKEEVAEYLAGEEAEELADILEVVDALAKVQGKTFEQIISIKEAKAQKNGKFEKKYFLEHVKY